jgi:hypothetical protein
VGASAGAEWIRYVLITSDSKETNRLITAVATTFEEVTVDSLSFESKYAPGTRWPTLRQRCQCLASVILWRLMVIQHPRIPAELALPRAAASIEFP